MAIRSVRMRKGQRGSERRRTSLAERYRDRRDGREEAPKIEVSAGLMILQTGFCVVVLLFGLLMRLSDSQPYYEAKQWYIAATTTPSEFQNPVAWVMGGGLERLRGQIMEVFSTQKEEESSNPEESESQPGEAQQIMAPAESGKAGKDILPYRLQTLGGSGGWWPWSSNTKEQTVQTVPAGCWSGRVILSAPAANPTHGVLTSGFGARRHPVSGQQDFHRGIDIAAPSGSGVYAAWPGTVTEVGYSNIYGNYIKIEHSPKLSTMYSHCLEILAKPRINVSSGDRIALVGSTGISTGNHLHFDLIVNGLFVNPIYAFDFIDYEL